MNTYSDDVDSPCRIEEDTTRRMRRAIDDGSRVADQDRLYPLRPAAEHQMRPRSGEKSQHSPLSVRKSGSFADERARRRRTMLMRKRSIPLRCTLRILHTGTYPRSEYFAISAESLFKLIINRGYIYRPYEKRTFYYFARECLLIS